MPPKTIFTKEQVVTAAFEIAQEKGFAEVTARSVAKHLGSSVAPIYANFKTINDLLQAVVDQVFIISNELLGKQKGANVFENIGKASLEFARDYPVLFRELMLKPNKYMQNYSSMEASLLEVMADDEKLQGWTSIERRDLLFKMRVFQTGLSVMVANGHLPHWLKDEDVEDLLRQIGDECISIARNKREGQ